MNYYEAPSMVLNDPNLTRYNSIFLAGSITGASDWQKDVAACLLPDFNVFNPRRKNFDVSDSSVEREQITWEKRYLKYCANVLFYFAPETLAPITLFEYGWAIAKSQQHIFVCVHPEYKRKNDVLIQTELVSLDYAKNISFDLGKTIVRIMDKKTELHRWDGIYGGGLI